MNEIVRVVIIIASAVILGILTGCGSIYIFNRVPSSWLKEYDGKALKGDPDSYPRVNGRPWKFVFTCLFIVIGGYLGVRNLVYAPATVISLFIILMIAISDYMYMIIPDQFVLMLIPCALGFIPYKMITRPVGFWQVGLEMIGGAIMGAGLIAIVGLGGRILYKRWAVGDGDLKLFAALGFLTDARGAIYIFSIQAIMIGAHFTYLMARGKMKPVDEYPIVPYVFIASIIYMVIIYDLV